MGKSRVIGPWYSDNGFIPGATNAATALAGGGQSGATLLTSQITRFTTVASSGDSAMLPVSAPGLNFVVINSGTNNLAVYPQTGDAINGQSANSSVTIAPGLAVTFFCAVAGAWTSDDESQALLPDFPITTLAAAGSTQAGAGAITYANVLVTTTTSSEGVRLPATIAGRQVRLTNTAAVGVKVYPPSGSLINALATNIGVVQPAGATNIYYADTSTKWVTQESFLRNGYAQPLAAVGSTQGGAGAITSSLVIVSTTTSAEGVRLPPSILGRQVVLVNNAALACKVYPPTSSNIGTLGANTAALQPSGSTNIYYAVSTTKWVTEFPLLRTEAFQTLAAAGATTGNAAVITYSRVSVTVTASTEGVRLPTPVKGQVVTVSVPGTIGVKVYPHTGGTLDAGGANAAVVLVAGKTNQYFTVDAAKWQTFKGS